MLTRLGTSSGWCMDVAQLWHMLMSTASLILPYTITWVSDTAEGSNPNGSQLLLPSQSCGWQSALLGFLAQRAARPTSPLRLIDCSLRYSVPRLAATSLLSTKFGCDGIGISTWRVTEGQDRYGSWK